MLLFSSFGNECHVKCQNKLGEKQGTQEMPCRGGGAVCRVLRGSSTIGGGGGVRHLRVLSLSGGGAWQRSEKLGEDGQDGRAGII